MKKFLLTFVFVSTSLMAQTTQELKKEIEGVKTEVKETKATVNSLQSQINTVVTQNNYLKEKLKINTPILEQKGYDISYKVTKVVGDRKTKTIQINLLIKAIKERHTFYLNDVSIFDLEGNEIKMRYKNSEYQGTLSAEIPKKIRLYFTYDKQELEGDFPKIIRLLRFNNDFNNLKQPDRIEFRDLNVTWN